MQLPEKLYKENYDVSSEGPSSGKLWEGGARGRGGLVTKSRRSFFDFTSHEKQNFIFTIFRNTEA